MTKPIQIVHVLDDLAMGGVTRALKNFEHPKLKDIGVHEIADVRKQTVRAASPNDIAVIHFTANWQKLRWLLDLKTQGGFSRVILIEHTYTRGYEASEVKPKRRFRLMLRLAYRLVDQVVAVSENQRDWILEHKLAPETKVVAIPQSRLCEDLLKLPHKPRENGPLQIRAFGRFHKQKGFDLLIQAMERVPAHMATLQIAGAGPDEARLQDLSGRLKHVEICQSFKSPEQFLSSADIVAIPSRWEAFGLVGTEARAAGRPILAAKVDGLCDQLDASGFGHSVNSVPSLVKAIYRAALANDLSERGQQARVRAADEFDTMIDRWHSLLSQ
ncbi:MAG: glycosyltransferase family 4 protein [Pseudomonadota bacterium]